MSRRQLPPVSRAELRRLLGITPMGPGEVGNLAIRKRHLWPKLIGPNELGSRAVQPDHLDGSTLELLSGAYIHFGRVSVQSIPPGGAAIDFDAMGLLSQSGFVTITPGTDIVIPVTAYWDVEFGLEWDTFEGGGRVWLTRNGTTIWPPLGMPSGVFESDDARIFTPEIAKGISCQDGDVLQIWVDPQNALAQDLLSAFVTVELVDRLISVGVSSLLITEAVAQTATTVDPWFDETFSFGWDGGSTVYLSGSEDGTAQWLIDNELELYVTHPDGSTNAFPEVYGQWPSAPSLQGPDDVTSNFEPGTNTVRVVFRDYGNVHEASEIWLTAPGV